MRILPTLLLTCGLCAAELVPTLSEPRRININAGISYNAWGDTLVAGRTGRLLRFVRRADEVVLLDSLVSNEIHSEAPRVLPSGDGYHVVVSKSSLLAAQWGQGGGLTNLAPNAVFDVGYGRASGDFAYDYSKTPYTRHLVLCNQDFQNPQSRTWNLIDSAVGAASTTVCDVDTRTNQGVRIVVSSNGVRSQIASGNSLQLFHATTDSIPFRPTSVLAAWDGKWLAFNQNSGTLYLGANLQQGDSLRFPEVTTSVSNYPTRTAPVRKDSLVVIGVDSSLVLLKWTAYGVKVVKTVKLDAAVSYGIAIADSTLWVQTPGALLSFRVSWQEPPQTNVQARSMMTGSLRASAISQGLSLLWNGMGSVPVDVLALDGSVAARTTLSPNVAMVVPALRPGLYLVRSPAGSRKVLVGR